MNVKIYDHDLVNVHVIECNIQSPFCGFFGEKNLSKLNHADSSHLTQLQMSKYLCQVIAYHRLTLHGSRTTLKLSQDLFSQNPDMFRTNEINLFHC